MVREKLLDDMSQVTNLDFICLKADEYHVLKIQKDKASAIYGMLCYITDNIK